MILQVPYKGVSENRGYLILGSLLIIRILLFRVLLKPLSSFSRFESPVTTLESPQRLSDTLKPCFSKPALVATVT